MAFGELENKILELIYDEDSTMDDIERLFEQGADPNAIENEPYPVDYIDDQPYYKTFFSELLFANNINKRFDIKAVLQRFLDRGVDVKKFGSSIIDDLKFADYEDDDIYEMTKMILNASEEKISLAVAKDGIGTEESYLSCCRPLGEADEMNDVYSNHLFGLYELLVAYEEGREYEACFPCGNALGQLVRKISITGEPCMVNAKDFRVKFSRDYSNLRTVIELENDQLIVEGVGATYVCNENDAMEVNSFSEGVAEELAGTRLTDIKFKHRITELRAHVTTVQLVFSNGNCLEYYSNDDNTEGVRLTKSFE